MPERRYCFWRKHDQWVQYIIIPEPPINTNYMKHERDENANKDVTFPLSLYKYQQQNSASCLLPMELKLEEIN